MPGTSTPGVGCLHDPAAGVADAPAQALQNGDPRADGSFKQPHRRPQRCGCREPGFPAGAAASDLTDADGRNRPGREPPRPASDGQ